MRSEKSGLTKEELGDVIEKQGTPQEAKRSLQKLIDEGKAKRLKGGWIKCSIPREDWPVCLQERISEICTDGRFKFEFD